MQILDSEKYASEVHFRRRDFPISRNICRLDEKRLSDPHTRVAEPRRFMNLKEDLQRIDPNIKIKALPRDGSTPSQVEALIDEWEEKIPEVLWLDKNLIPESIEVEQCRHLVRYPAKEPWTNKESGILCSLEEHLLGDKEENQKAGAKNESILAGQGYSFKTLKSAETTSTMIPTNPPIIRAKNWKDLNEKLDQHEANVEALGNFKFQSASRTSPAHMEKEEWLERRRHKIIDSQIFEVKFDGESEDDDGKEDESPDSVSENEVFKEENELYVTPERKPVLSPEPVKRQKAKRQRDPSTPTASDGSTDSSTDSETFDFGDPDDCASYFKSIMGTSLKVDSNTQRRKRRRNS